MAPPTRKLRRAGAPTFSDRLMPINLAVRDWARREEPVAARLRRVDNRRMDYLRSLFSAFCPDPDDVEARPMLAFSLLIGDGRPPTASDRSPSPPPPAHAQRSPGSTTRTPSSSTPDLRPTGRVRSGLFERQPGGLLFATFLRLSNPLARVIWMALVAARHRTVVRHLLARGAAA
jgi:hypothetical protein